MIIKENEQINYQQLDYEEQKRLILQIQKNKDKKNDINFKILLIKYESFIKKISNKVALRFDNSPLKFEDYFQYGIYCFYKRTINYKLDGLKKFASYIETFIEYDLKNYAKKFTTKNHILLNYAIPIDNDNFNYNLILKEETFKDDEDFMTWVIKTIDFKIFTDKENKILEKLLETEGSVKETAEKLNIPAKTIYRYRKKITNKLKVFSNIE
ncbi:/ / RNA polymerase factor sigma-70 / 540231:540866 Reverse [Candidatus Hepatoplasma crinochetorum]|uniref:/ / RNA polymerase factor sigma-70 / 540231:540866 Reverse n=1 Tax=Candidatus Hepatoplasma crinochetorum TaxID=295596 RepID=A0A0G7ZN25_9MOLU|nr:/ / RNA polymerase factor sigma-70 / 540231:540866 Reverse [Candidatus Hepatoplasma crinochetorum]